MLYLGPVNDAEARKYFAERNIVFNENSKCVSCKDGQDVIGLCLFELDKEKITVKYIEPTEDILLADGILRSSLHVAAERGIMNAFYTDTVSEDFLKKIGFIKNAEEKRLDIDKLFKSCCGCDQ